MSNETRKAKKLYARRDAMEQGQFYADHISAMTTEELHSKADIAKELAHRDIKIDKLIKLATKAVAILNETVNLNHNTMALDIELKDILAE